MCGIIGYVGKKAASPILLEGLRRLEYRGYDSAGLAVLADGKLAVRKRLGRIDAGLAPLLAEQPAPGSPGIAHTRWATHGIPSDANSHPHLDAAGRLAIVHNGVIENCDALKQRLRRAGPQFLSDTDTEVLAHLIGHHCAAQPLSGPDALTRAVAAALREVIGTYGLAVLSADHPDKQSIVTWGKKLGKKGLIKIEKRGREKFWKKV